MSTPRRYPGAAALPDGRVLVAGGGASDEATALSSAEIFDPTTRTWSPTTPMHEPRLAPTAVTLSDGTVLVAGGASARDPGQPYPAYRATATAEVYDPSSATWTYVGSMPFEVMAGTGLLLPDGRVLVVGMATTGRFEVCLYDPVSRSWSAGTHPVYGQLGRGGTLLPSGEALFLVPGSAGSRAVLYDYSTDTWRDGPTMGQGGYYAAIATLPSGRALIASGENLNVPAPPPAAVFVDATGSSATPAPPPDVPRFTAYGVILSTGEVLEVGSEPASLLFDEARNAWTPPASMPFTPQWGAVVVPLRRGGALVAGGGAEIEEASNSATSAAEELIRSDEHN